MVADSLVGPAIDFGMFFFLPLGDVLLSPQLDFALGLSQKGDGLAIHRLNIFDSVKMVFHHPRRNSPRCVKETLCECKDLWLFLFCLLMWKMSRENAMSWAHLMVTGSLGTLWLWIQLETLDLLIDSAFLSGDEIPNYSKQPRNHWLITRCHTILDGFIDRKPSTSNFGSASVV